MLSFLIDPPTSPDPDLVGVGDTKLRIIHDCFQLSSQFGRLPPIVTIQESHPGIASQSNSVIAGCTHSGSFPAHVLNPLIGKVFDDGIRTVG
jgi:hypothetical protein